MSRLHPIDLSITWQARSELSDGDIRDLQQKGDRMVVLKPDYQASDLDDARKERQSQGAN
jgi:hypothetical protein